MLPTVLSHELIEAISAFLRSTYPSSTPAFEESFDGVLEGTGRGKLFQGPYLRVSLPFKPGTKGQDFFPRLQTAFPPYVHQEQAWQRLNSETGLSTLVATGTGSGKTECFTYPILDHVLANPSERGIKAIILYPMNALATDQARRFAREVHSNSACKGRVRVGLYVGGLDSSGGTRQMTESSVITSREELRDAPPDILLTNYKMLDYLLVRKEDRKLWAHNGPDTLRYLVVDELHTFDGAQGTDLACLIRRVKARVKTPSGHLVCVGTSATLGGDDSLDSMTRFAEAVFGADFEEASVVMETRKSAGEHLEGASMAYLELQDFEPPGEQHFESMDPAGYDSLLGFVQAQVPLWFESSLASTGSEPPDLATPAGKMRLATMLRRHNFLRVFLGNFKEGVLSEDALLDDLKHRRGSVDVEHHRRVLNSFVSLCALARDGEHPSAYFLQIRAELWMRELSRMVASVHVKPEIRFSMDLPSGTVQKHLAPIHCRDCGAMGWGAIAMALREQLDDDLDLFYRGFFSRYPDPCLRFVFPMDEQGVQGTLFKQHLCGHCLSLFENATGECPECGTKPYVPSESDEAPPAVSTFPVWAGARTIQREEKTVADKSCPFCESSTGLTIVGSRAASLTSVGLSQLFGSPFNDDKKAMAFSDSVQDASHRAGFFTGRTYPIVVRTALYRVLAEAGEPIALSELSERFPATWLTTMEAGEFVGTFIPPAIEWLDEYEAFKRDQRLRRDNKLTNKVKRRLAWDVIREFGLQCRIGRTLEKSGVAGIEIAADALGKAAASALPRIHDLGGGYTSVEAIDIERLMTALCERLRVNGGVWHPLLESYLERRGDEYLFNRNEELRKIRRAGTGRRPTFFATFRMRDTFERLIASGSKATWTEQYTTKWSVSLLGDTAMELDPTPVIEAVVAALEEAEIWRRTPVTKSPDDISFGLVPERILVSTESVHHACEQCGHRATSSQGALKHWKHLPCLRHSCRGRYLPMEESRNYFGTLYKTGDVVRMRAAEHTGLLDRPTREEVEQEFMREPPHPTDVRLLSCTPTMEMGVDVGDLSTVVLCSVPPEQANYLQRIGRGGRRDGNSLAVTVANSDAHDLSYYEDPLRMIDGEVQLPAVFLRAPAVLERQLTAFCVDRWIETNPSAMIPKRMDAIYGQLEAEAKGDSSEGAFPNALYHFIELEQTALLDGFFAMFERGELDEDSSVYLKDFLSGNAETDGSLPFKINRAIAGSFKDREALYRKRKELHKRISANNRKKEARDEQLDEQLEHLKAERKGVSALIKTVNHKQTLNFLTDEGLLPNYAFPEEGVTLKSVILKRKEKDVEEEGSKLSKTEFEHMRPAASALTELAPGNTFYVQGRRLLVDQISIDQDGFETWHFCRSCSHLEPLTEKSENYDECPKCHCKGWRDASLRQDMLRMRQVFVTAWDRYARSLDEKDDRELTVFNKQVAIDFKKAAVRKSYILRSQGTSFSFEFLDEITLRETNFGVDQWDADQIQIGGKTMFGAGFRVCRHCGKIQLRDKRQRQKHDISCQHFGKDLPEEEFAQTFLLYRQLESEAIRVLIPTMSQDDGIDTQSFVGAVHLGLKEKFGGYLSHLNLAVQKLPIGDGKFEAKHLFIYDSVPGGTGYLKELTRNAESLFEVLQTAYDALTNCPCGEDPELDGCYRCIRAYRFRFVMSKMSRAKALRQLERILEKRDAVEERSVEASLVNPLLESELERRFIESLRQAEGFQVNPEIVDGRPGFLLRVGTASWKVVPQVELGPEQGVSIACRPDVVLRPLRSSQGLPIAVFLDGFAFHASEELDYNRVADDMRKRNAVRRSGKYLVWSITWGDLREDEQTMASFLEAGYPGLGPVLGAVAESMAHAPAFADAAWTSWDLLKWYLADLGGESETAFGDWQTACVFFACNFPSRQPTDAEGYRSTLQNLVIGADLSWEQGTGDHMASSHREDRLCVASAVPTASLKARSTEGTRTCLWFDDTGDCPKNEFLEAWREFLRASNLLQFTPNFLCLTRNMGREGGFANAIDELLEARAETEAVSEVSSLEPDQLRVLEFVDPSILPVLAPMVKSGAVPFPDIGYEHIKASGKLSGAMLEAAWPALKIGVATQADDAAPFVADGWTVLEGLSSEDLLLNAFTP